MPHLYSTLRFVSLIASLAAGCGTASNRSAPEAIPIPQRPSFLFVVVNEGIVLHLYQDPVYDKLVNPPRSQVSFDPKMSGYNKQYLGKVYVFAATKNDGCVHHVRAFQAVDGEVPWTLEEDLDRIIQESALCSQGESI